MSHAFRDPASKPNLPSMSPTLEPTSGTTSRPSARRYPIWGGAQLAVDTTIVSPLTRDGQPRRRAGQYAGTALTEARRRKERTYPELMRSRRCRLIVLGIERGGRWSEEAARFVKLLARESPTSTPPPPELGGSCPHQPMDGPVANSWPRPQTHPPSPAASQPLLKELWLGLGQLPRNAGATGIEMANSFRPMPGDCPVKQSENLRLLRFKKERRKKK